MRICWVSPSVVATTGYGTQSKEIIGRILKEGKHKVWNLGGVGGKTVWGGKQAFPYEELGVKIPVLVTSGDMTGKDQIDMYIKMYDFDAIFALWDCFVLGWMQEIPLPTVAYIPIDSEFTYSMYKNVRDMSKIIAYSKFGYNELLKWFPPSKLNYIPHGINTELFKPSSKNEQKELREKNEIPEDAFMVLANGANIGERKQFPNLMLIFKDFLKTHPDAYLYMHTNPNVIFPQGYDLVGFADQLKIRDRVKFPAIDPILDPMEWVDMAKLYSSADVFLTTTLAEGFGLPVVESMACGTPVIGSNCSTLPEHIGDTGWLIDMIDDYCFVPVWIPTLQSYKVPSMKSALQCLTSAYDNPSATKLLGNKARERIKSLYSWDVVFPMWSKLLEEMSEELRYFKNVY